MDPDLGSNEWYGSEDPDSEHCLSGRHIIGTGDLDTDSASVLDLNPSNR